jgi:hypothetical protein
MNDQQTLADSSPPQEMLSWGGLTLRILVYSLIGLFFLSVDVFGIKKVTQRYSEMALYNVIAPAYGMLPFALPQRGYGASAQEALLWNRNISVILLDDKALKEGDKSGVTRGGIGWPAPMRYHVKLLSDLYYTYKPAVIMVDILFFDERPGDEEAL